jgi:hypothetical protein
MKGAACAVMMCLLSQSMVADETATSGLAAGGGGTITLKRAIAVEAARLAESATRERRGQSRQLSNRTDTRPWCVRHGAGCFALIGYAIGFIGGLMHPADDFVPEGWALLFSGPIGAGVGAAVGWGIAEGTKPQPRSRQP